MLLCDEIRYFEDLFYMKKRIRRGLGLKIV